MLDFFRSRILDALRQRAVALWSLPNTTAEVGRIREELEKLERRLPEATSHRDRERDEREKQQREWKREKAKYQLVAPVSSVDTLGNQRRDTRRAACGLTVAFQTPSFEPPAAVQLGVSCGLFLATWLGQSS